MSERLTYEELEQRVRALEASQTLRSQSLMGELLESIQAGVVVHDGNGTVINSNTIAQSMLGLTSEQMLGKELTDPAWTFLREDGSPLPVEEYPAARVLATQKTVHNLVVGIQHGPTAEPIWVLNSAHPEFDETGHLCQIVTTFMDISPLKKGEEQYRNLFENMMHEVHLWQLVRDEQGAIQTWRLLEANPAALNAWGKKRSEVVGKTTNEIFAYDATAQFMPIVQKIFAEGKPYTWEAYFPPTDQFFHMTSVPFGEYFMSTGVDITQRKQIQLALEQELLLSKTLFNVSIDGIVLLNHQGNVLQASHSFAQMLGYSLAETGTLNVVDWDAQFSRAELQAILEDEVLLPPRFETQHRRQDGSVCDVEISYSREVLNGEAVHFCICRDVSDRKQAEAERNRLLAVLEASLNEIYLFWSDTLKFEYANQGALENLGYSLEQLQQKTPLDIMPELSAPELAQQLTPLRQDQVSKLHFETVHQRADGSCYPVDVYLQTTHYGGQPAFLAIALDISDRKRAEAQLIHQALHDSLTDLPNRTLLNDRLELALKRAQQSATYQFAVLFLDLDQFKVVNDSLGHQVGDELLIHVAQKLQTIIRPADIAARPGGDEFVILLEHLSDLQAATQIAERILADFEHPIAMSDHSIFITTSIGLVWGDRHYNEASSLLRDADIALYRAKAAGRGGYAIFDGDMHVQAMKRMQLEHDLRVAVAQQVFALHYQPIVDLKTQQITGFEALIRWDHPTRGFISPDEFIPVAEETGMIAPISRWVLQTACEQAAQWRSQWPHRHHLRMSINLSGYDLRQATLVETVQHVLTQTQLPAHILTLEITESMLIEDIETAIERLLQLQELGVRISIDDFGTGYSSLSYLYNLPANYLKIDKSFVSQMQLGNTNYKIVEAVVTLSDQLGLAAIAEGIETPQQLNWLEALGCELGQGYLLSRPLSTEAATALLSAQST
ncbi:sensor domain-containing protein [Leptolyngbya iicbica]|uniref:EAL domain-containing protein n=2 Tax=Cyanophyceae TaxID=3028117 RepID=A0A4Q7E501_9CYAN|nr:EAL domain-containing protein [Leptolyngbya sp. LK]RZM77144.1 EAL domain-containing protein [Leptolyngbya sp. LK]